MGKRTRLCPEITDMGLRSFLDMLPSIRSYQTDLLQNQPRRGQLLTIPLDGRELTVLFHKASSTESRPVVFEFHGGGFMMGNAEKDDSLCRKISRTLDCHVIGVNYRLAPEHPYPAAVDDAYDVIRYFKDHADEYRINLEKMAVFGYSAGATLATVTAMRAKASGDFSLCAQVLHYPYLDAVRLPEEKEHYDCDMDVDVMRAFTLLYSKENERKLERYRNGDLKVLINVNILTEGVDLPQTKTVFLARPTVSTILMTQMIGRALRGTAAGGTEEAYIVSFIDNWNEHIAWVNPESLFVDKENDFSENEAERQKYQLQMIAISKIEEFASLLDKGVDTTALESIDFMKRIPVGMYAFTFMLQGDMEQSHQIMIYDSTRTAYENMMQDLPELFNEYKIFEEFPDYNDLRTMAEQIKDTYFVGEMIPPYSHKDIINILRYYAQYEIAPKFYTFEDVDRSKLDVSSIAKEVYEKDLRRSEEAEYLERLWNATDDNMLKLFFGQKKNFHGSLTALWISKNLT